MGKRKAPTQRQEEEEEIPRREGRRKQRHEQGTSSRGPVNPGFSSLFHNPVRAKLFSDKFHEREVLRYKYVDFTDLTKMYERQHVDTADYIASHGWTDFVQVNRPVFERLLRVLMANLEETTMTSWIGGRRIDLSIDAWSRIFHLPPVSDEEEDFILNLPKEELFFRLTGVRNLDMEPFIKINQLQQEANVRLTAQVVMNVLIPKKGSKEQIKVEEGRLLYAMIYGKQINLARMVVDRLRAAMGRKSSPICYGMHLTEMLAQAGVDLSCAGDSELSFSSAIDHHTLNRLGYHLQVSTWVYTRQGKKVPSEHGTDSEEEEGQAAPAPAAPDAPPQPMPPRSVSTEVAHLRQFMLEQLHLMQATIMSKLESMDSRLQSCEAHILNQPRVSPIPPPSSDPKGKAPMVSPTTSPIHISSPSAHHSSPLDPNPTPSASASSDSSTSQSIEYELSARTPASPHTSPHSSTADSEATPSPPPPPSHPPPTSPPPPSHPPPSHPLDHPTSSPPHPLAITPYTRTKHAARKNPSYTPSPPSPPSPTHVQPSPPPRPALTPYTRRKLAVSRPSPSPPPPSSQP